MRSSADKQSTSKTRVLIQLAIGEPDKYYKLALLQNATDHWVPGGPADAGHADKELGLLRRVDPEQCQNSRLQYSTSGEHTS